MAEKKEYVYRSVVTKSIYTILDKANGLKQVATITSDNKRISKKEAGELAGITDMKNMEVVKVGTEEKQYRAPLEKFLEIAEEVNADGNI